MTPLKPLGMKAYGHIPHLPDSRMGPADHACHVGQAQIATAKVRDRHDQVFVTEKLDGSCMAVARLAGEIVPLNRSGYRAISAPWKHQRLFHDWVFQNYGKFDKLLEEGDRVVGEWLALAHGTRYSLEGRLPFVPFDLLHSVGAASEREGYSYTVMRCCAVGLPTAPLLHVGGAISIEEVLERLGKFGHYGALDEVEGAVWRIERKGKFDFICKYVRPDKVDGSLLPEVSGEKEVWNFELNCNLVDASSVKEGKGV